MRCIVFVLLGAHQLGNAAGVAMLFVDVGLSRGIDVLLPGLHVGRLGDGGELDLFVPQRGIGLFAEGVLPPDAAVGDAGERRADIGNVAERPERNTLVEEDDPAGDDDGPLGWQAVPKGERHQC